MKMACLKGHFPILIEKDTKEDHERCITFLWNPNVLFVQPKTNLIEMTMVDDLLAN
jgi:hypothetical protein